MVLHIDTPLLQSRPLSQLRNKTVWLKMDALQPAGSFKTRGIGAACEAAVRQGKTRLLSSSGGNAGLAVAYAGRMLGVPVTVVVPESTTERARALIAEQGAEVIVHGASWQEANVLVQGMIDATSAFVHPFDDPVVWAGHATMIDEVVRSGARFDGVVLSVGGGGLLSGVAEGLRRNGLENVPIITVETTGAASLAGAARAGRRIELDAIRSIAVTLGAKMVSEDAFQLTQTRDVRCATVSDFAAVDACVRFLDDHRVLVEPACGASLAVIYGDYPDLLAGIEAPLVVVCGGSTSTLEQILGWHRDLAEGR
jgi:L-serine/L-threonine ammonia-lyase